METLVWYFKVKSYKSPAQPSHVMISQGMELLFFWLQNVLRGFTVLRIRTQTLPMEQKPRSKDRQLTVKTWNYWLINHQKLDTCLLGWDQVQYITCNCIHWLRLRVKKRQVLASVWIQIINENYFIIQFIFAIIHRSHCTFLVLFMSFTVLF